MEVLRAGIVGLGGMGKCHLNALLSCKDVELVALCDVNKSTLEKLTKELKVIGFTDFKEMFQKVKMDFVVIALPHHLHLKAVREASTKGIHILKEKPLARNYDEAKEIVKVVEKEGVKLMIATQRRYTRTFPYVKEFIDRDLLGDIVLIRGQYIFFISRELGWRGSLEKAGGGALLDPKSIYDRLRKKAEGFGMTVGELLIDILTNNLSSKEKAEEYARASLEFLELAKEELVKGNLREASEKIWGAVILIIKAHAYAKTGRRLTSHRELREYKDRVADELGSWVIMTFQQASDMHTNFYEGWVTKREVKMTLESVEKLVKVIAKRILPNVTFNSSS